MRGPKEFVMHRKILLVAACAMAMTPAALNAGPGHGGGGGMGHGGGAIGHEIGTTGHGSSAMGHGSATGAGIGMGQGQMDTLSTHVSRGSTNGVGWDHMNGPDSTGQPGFECEETRPGHSSSAPGSAFNEEGRAGTRYAGEQPQNSRNTASVSQYDTACLHQPQR